MDKAWKYIFDCKESGEEVDVGVVDFLVSVENPLELIKNPHAYIRFFFDEEEYLADAFYQALLENNPEIAEMRFLEALDELDPPVIKPNEIAAMIWLAREIGVKIDDFADALEIVRQEKNAYRVWLKNKKLGGKRKMTEPCDQLKKIQQKIAKNFLSLIPVSDAAFGFSGGGIVDALALHLNSKSILCVDFKDAFPSVKSSIINNFLTFGICPEYEKKKKLSTAATQILHDLVSLKGRLPQGAPTSPRLFDAVCLFIDTKITRLAKSVGGVYTRYADNIFFSFPSERFPRKVRNAILKKITGRRHCWNHEIIRFNFHKLNIRTMASNAIRALGLNIIDGRLHNTREFKRNLRLAIHHVNWLLDNGENYGVAWKKLQGKMSFARKDTLSPKLVEEYEKLKEKIFEKEGCPCS